MKEVQKRRHLIPVSMSQTIEEAGSDVWLYSFTACGCKCTYMYIHVITVELQERWVKIQHDLFVYSPVLEQHPASSRFTEMQTKNIALRRPGCNFNDRNVKSYNMQLLSWADNFIRRTTRTTWSIHGLSHHSMEWKEALSTSFDQVWNVLGSCDVTCKFVEDEATECWTARQSRSETLRFSPCICRCSL